jgi:heptosyltransferase-3
MNNLKRKQYSSERGSVKLRCLDRYIGIPLVFVLGLCKRKRILPEKITKVALLKTSAIGDTVLISAVVTELKKSYPGAHITLFTAASNYSFALTLQNIDKVILLPINKPFSAINKIRKSGKFDVFIDFGPWPRFNAVLSFFSLASYSIGFKTKNQYRHYIYDKHIEHSDIVHEIINYYNLVKPLGIQKETPPKIERSGIKNKNLVVIHMFPGGTKSYLKEWPSENWVALIDKINHCGYTVALTGAPSDRDRAESIRSSCNDIKHVTVTAGKSTIAETIELIGSSILTISVNTGIMHLASALQTNLVALHGPTSVKRWGPLNKNAISIIPTVPCAPCLNLGSEYKCDVGDCMQSISVNAVMAAVSEFLPRLERLSPTSIEKKKGSNFVDARTANCISRP